MSRQPNPKAPSGFDHDCPSCGAPTQVIDRFTLDGVPDPVEHVKVRCVIGHWFTIPADWLSQAAAAVEQPATSSAGR